MSIELIGAILIRNNLRGLFGGGQAIGEKRFTLGSYRECAPRARSASSSLPEPQRKLSGVGRLDIDQGPLDLQKHNRSSGNATLRKNLS